MKFNKEKTKKFASGGKSPKEIMEEARRNQAIEKQAQARDKVKTSGIAAYQSTPVTIQAPRQEVVLKEYEPSTFSQAFRQARKAGLKEFTWRGDRFNTDLEDTSQTTKTNTSAVNNSTVNAPLSEEQLRRNAIIREHGTEGLEISNTTYDGGVLPELIVTTAIPKIIPQQRDNTNIVIQHPQDIARSKVSLPDLGTIGPAGKEQKKIDWGWLRRKLLGLNQGSILYKQGGQLPAYQQGGQILKYQAGAPIYKRTLWERFWNIKPKTQPVLDSGDESIRKYRDGNVDIYEIIKDVPYGNGSLTSTRRIVNPGTTEPDTLYVRPDGEKFKSKDIKKNPSLQSYPDKFNRYFKYQQGGTMEESGPTDEMYVDFAVRFLSKLGVGEKDMVDEEGGLKDEHAETVTVALQELESTPEFWDTYVSDPDAAVDAYIESKQSPEQVEMARKGAKLKKLQKLKKGTAKKCKCGCDLIIKKEKGGTITEVCSCGCKAK